MHNDFEKYIGIINKLVSGEQVNCPQCGEPLVLRGQNSGTHPGVFCPSDDFEILIEFDLFLKN